MSTYAVSCIANETSYEMVTALFYSIGMLGCEETPEKSGVRLRAYFKTQGAAEEAVSVLRDLSGVQSAVIEAVEDRDWNAKWRESMKPAELAQSFWVSPLWLTPPLKSGDHWIKIEPKMAFGTGHHETTRLAARALIGLG